ncbi:hypothetical protein GWL_45340 [Herbaspirillum sp. GW103]|nr:hypothetical protein GWL_45340 [Herbaspirillum sp. GW103]
MHFHSPLVCIVVDTARRRQQCGAGSLSGVGPCCVAGDLGCSVRLEIQRPCIHKERGLYKLLILRIPPIWAARAGGGAAGLIG